MIIATAERFDVTQLNQLQASLSPEVLGWAESEATIRPNTGANEQLRDIAAIHAVQKAALAPVRLNLLREAVDSGVDLDQQYPSPGHHTPAYTAGTAAGQLAVAIRTASWYDLGAEDFQRQHPHVLYAHDIDIQNAIYNPPYTRGFTDVSGSDFFVGVVRLAEADVLENGPGAIDSYMQFPDGILPEGYLSQI